MPCMHNLCEEKSHSRILLPQACRTRSQVWHSFDGQNVNIFEGSCKYSWRKLKFEACKQNIKISTLVCWSVTECKFLLISDNNFKMFVKRVSIQKWLLEKTWIEVWKHLFYHYVYVYIFFLFEFFFGYIINKLYTFWVVFHLSFFRKSLFPDKARSAIIWIVGIGHKV